MRVFVAVLVLIFSLQSWTKAEDIRDFEIEGITIGDSLLDHFSKSEIKENLSKTISMYTNKDFKKIGFYSTKNETYEFLNIHFKNNSKYEIASLGGLIFYENDMKRCHKKQDEIIKDLKETFPNSEISSLEISKHSSDKSGESKVRDIWFVLSNGQIYINCTDWSEKITRTRNWGDELGVYIETDEFVDWLNNKSNK